MSRIVVVALGALLSAWLLVAGHAAAAPKLDAIIAWQGECDDRAALKTELEARGAELNEVAAGATAVTLGIVVRHSGDGLLGTIELTAAGSHENRQVEARDCLALRRAVAWVLGVFAEERAAAEHAPGPSAAAFPAPSLPPAAAPKPAAPEPAPALPQPEPPAASPVSSAKPCSVPGPRLGLGSELQLGVGFVRAVTLGPAVVGSYRPCARWLPGFSLGAAELVSRGYEVDGRAIRVQRTSAQLGVWLTLGVPMLRAGLTLEVGRIHAAAVASEAGRGGSANAPWLAVAVPLKLEVPLLSPALTANLGICGVYAPRQYVLRYATAGDLASTGHFELRGAVGLTGHF